MAKHHPANERIKRKYLIYLQEANQMAEFFLLIRLRRQLLALRKALATRTLNSFTSKKHAGSNASFLSMSIRNSATA